MAGGYTMSCLPRRDMSKGIKPPLKTFINRAQVYEKEETFGNKGPFPQAKEDPGEI